MERKPIAASILLFLIAPSLMMGATAHLGQPVMGTVLQVTVLADDAAVARRLAGEAIGIARHWDVVLTIWRPEGELARFNAAAGSGRVGISPDLRTTFVQMRALNRDTGGAFDPAVGTLVRLWRGSTGPSLAAQGAAGPHHLAEVLTEGEGTATLVRGAELDPGAIGKAIALDAIAIHLRRANAHAAFLNGISEGEILGIIHLRDASLSTSRAIGKAAAEGPIIDPRDGRPVPAPRLATVLAANATAANGWSTALIVLGRGGLDRGVAHGVEALVADERGMRQTAGFPLVSARPLTR
jgi:thiamine biosynthesis lipoprotein